MVVHLTGHYSLTLLHLSKSVVDWMYGCTVTLLTAKSRHLFDMFLHISKEDYLFYRLDKLIMSIWPELLMKTFPIFKPPGGLKKHSQYCFFFSFFLSHFNLIELLFSLKVVRSHSYLVKYMTLPIVKLNTDAIIRGKQHNFRLCKPFLEYKSNRQN